MLCEKKKWIFGYISFVSVYTNLFFSIESTVSKPGQKQTTEAKFSRRKIYDYWFIWEPVHMHNWYTNMYTVYNKRWKNWTFM